MKKTLKKSFAFLLATLICLSISAVSASAVSVEEKAVIAAASSAFGLQKVVGVLTNNSTFDILFKAYAIRTKSNLGILSRFNASSHLMRNMELAQDLYPDDSPALLDAQSFGPVASLLYGTRNMSYNGCELIAVHNVLLDLGRFKELPQIVYDFESAGTIWMEGEFGTKIAQYKNYLQKQGLTLEEYRDAKSLDEARQDGDVFIITYSWKNINSPGWPIGIHTVMVKQTDGQLYAYNLNGWSYNSFEELENHHGIYLLGYRIST